MQNQKEEYYETIIFSFQHTARQLEAFAGPIDDNCSTIYDSIIAGDISKAEDAASKVYAQKSACSATNLADLAIIYHQLVDRSSDAVTRYDYVLKTIDCYNSAVDKDSNAARARFTEKGWTWMPWRKTTMPTCRNSSRRCQTQ